MQRPSPSGQAAQLRLQLAREELRPAVDKRDDSGLLGVLTLTSIAVYVFAFQASWGSIVWVMLGEIFPLGVRAAAMGLATTALWFGNGVVALSFPVLLESLGVGVLVAGLAVICAIAFTWFKVPETKGRSLEQIEEDFSTEAVPVIPDAVKRV